MTLIRILGLTLLLSLSSFALAGADGDGVPDGTDNCPNVVNSDQLDTDSDGLGDLCDADDDGDGVADGVDAFPLISLSGRTDTDDDGYPDDCDEDCLATGMTADSDDDNDGLLDEIDPCPSVDGRYSSELAGVNPDISRFEFCASEGASGPVLELFIEVSDSFSDTTNASFLYWYVNNKQTWVNISREDSSQPFRASVELHPNAASGTYAVRAFTIKDNDDLELSLNEGQLNDLGFLTQTVLTNPEADNKVPEIASFASDGWSFDSEGNPQLKATVAVVEDGSDVVENTLILELLSPTGASLQTRSDSFQDNTANFTLTLSKYAASGIYPVNTVRFSDYAGNNQMSQAWLQENPKVFELDNPLGDQEAPELLAFKLSATFDNSSNRPVIRINGTAYDSASQVDGVYLRLNRPSGGILDKWVKDRANKETLEFSNQIPLTTEFQSGTYEVGFLRLNDVAENTVRFVKADITDLGEEFSTELNVYFPGEEEVSKGETKVVASGKSDFVFGANESDDVIEAGEGNDEIYTGSGDDDVDAGPGDDTITGGSGEGDDIYNGGAGSDRVVYTSSTLGVVVDLKDGTASGSEIGADTLISIESVVGGLGPDTFTFNEENNTILGEGGDDKFFNLEMLGVDFAFGGEGADSFYWSGQGSFTLSGDAGRDTFYPEELVEKGKVVIKDFDAEEGDVLVLASLLPTLGNAWSDLKGGLASVSEVLTLDQENGFHSLNLSESYRDESGKILIADIYGLSEAPGLESILDTDGDGVADGSDAFPLDAAESIDTDLDGMGNNADTDDGDGVADISDAFPLDSAETLDTDSDGTGNNADTDDDNDEVSDADEAKNGTNPLLGDTDGDGVADNLDEITVALSFDDRTFKVEITTSELADNPITATDFRFGPKGSSCFVELQSDKEAQSTSEKYVASRSWQVGSNFLSGQYGVIDDTPRIFFEDGSVKYDQQQYFLTVSNPDYVEQEIALEKVVISKVQDAVGELRVEATISGVSNEGFLSAYPFSSDARYNFKVHLKNGATYHGDAPHPEDVTKISDGVFKVATFHTVDNADDYANPKVQLIQVCDAAMHSKVWEQDADADGMIDVADAFPLDATETLDTDSDGTGNNADTDDDGDGVADSSDAFPLDASETADIDSDGVGDNSDAFPNDATESLDSDSDSVGDNADNCPSISNAAQTNTDGDADGDACDSDDDNDGFTDEQELVDGTNPLSRFSCKTGCFSFDVDENLEAQPLTDGLLVIRHLFGFSGDSLTSGAVSGEASRGYSEAIAGYLTDADSELDIDGDGESKPLTDGLLLIRYLFGFSGDSLISGAIGSGATRDTADEVEAYIQKRVPAN